MYVIMLPYRSHLHCNVDHFHATHNCNDHGRQCHPHSHQNNQQCHLYYDATLAIHAIFKNLLVLLPYYNSRCHQICARSNPIQSTTTPTFTPFIMHAIANYFGYFVVQMSIASKLLCKTAVVPFTCACNPSHWNELHHHV